MKPTLEEIKSNYNRVLLRLHSGELAGIVDDEECLNLQVLRKTHWIDRAITTSDLDKSYCRKNAVTDFNIDAIAFLKNAIQVDDFLRCDECDIEWDWDINNTHNLKFKKGDNVIIKSTECRDSYKCALECIGTIVDAEYTQYIDDERITYRVRINNLDNKYQTDGLWVFHEEKSLELCTATNMTKLCDAINHPIYSVEPQRMSDLCFRWNADELSSDYIKSVVDSFVQPTEEIKTFNIKGENEMNKIVELYEERNRDKIYTEYKKKCAKIKLADDNYKVYKECVDKLTPIYEKTKQCFHDITEPYLSEETAKKLDELALKKEAELTKLENELDEIKAQISMCETYEQKQSVLKLYKVIDENGKLNA